MPDYEPTELALGDGRTVPIARQVIVYDPDAPEPLPPSAINTEPGIVLVQRVLRAPLVFTVADENGDPTDDTVEYIGTCVRCEVNLGETPPRVAFVEQRIPDSVVNRDEIVAAMERDLVQFLLDQGGNL